MPIDEEEVGQAPDSLVTLSEVCTLTMPVIRAMSNGMDLRLAHILYMMQTHVNNLLIDNASQDDLDQIEKYLNTYREVVERLGGQEHGETQRYKERRS